MKNFWKYTLLLIVVNLLLIASGFAQEQLFGLAFVLFVLQMIVGTILCFVDNGRVIGQAMLAACSIILVVGFSVCTLTFMNG